MNNCKLCEKQVDEDDTVWIDPHTGDATTGDKGVPFHVECAPSQDGAILYALTAALENLIYSCEGDEDWMFEHSQNCPQSPGLCSLCDARVIVKRARGMEK